VTDLQVRPLHRFSLVLVMAQTTWTGTRVCLFGDSLILHPISGSNCPKPLFMGVNRLFQAKHANIQTVILSNYCTDYNQILHNDKDHQVILVGGPNKLQRNPKWWMAILKIWKIAISTTNWPILMKF